MRINSTSYFLRMFFFSVIKIFSFKNEGNNGRCCALRDHKSECIKCMCLDAKGTLGSRRETISYLLISCYLGILEVLISESTTCIGTMVKQDF